ncbi:MAG: hypothetical protein AAFX85_11255, partial [Pseudomonadota bacterium]
MVPIDGDSLEITYRQALRDGDDLARSEILQFAKHHPEVAQRLLAAEEDVLGTLQTPAIDIDAVLANIHVGASVSRRRSAIEAWIVDHGNILGSLLQVFPLLAAIGFGASLYALGQRPEPTL